MDETWLVFDWDKKNRCPIFYFKAS